MFDLQKQTDNRGFSTAGTVLGVVIVAIIGVAAYIQWGGTTTGSAPTMDDIVSAHESVESFQYNTNLTLEAQLNPDELTERSDAQQLRQSLQYIPNTPSEGFPESLTAELSVDGGVSLASSTVDRAHSDVSVSVGVDELEEVLALNFRKTGGQQYLRAQTLPEIGFFSLSQFEGQWYSASSTDTAQLGSTGMMGQLPSGVPAGANVSQETSRKLLQAMISEEVITVEGRTRTELRSGAPAWQFQLGVNPEQADSYQEAARDILREDNPELADRSGLFATSSETSDFQSGLEQFDNRVDTFNVWIDRNSDRVRRVVIEAVLDKSELTEISEDGSRLDGVEQATITFDTGLSAYNQPIDVEVPEDAQPLRSLFQGGMMPAGSGQPSGNTPMPPVQY